MRFVLRSRHTAHGAAGHAGRIRHGARHRRGVRLRWHPGADRSGLSRAVHRHFALLPWAAGGLRHLRPHLAVAIDRDTVRGAGAQPDPLATQCHRGYDLGVQLCCPAEPIATRVGSSAAQRAAQAAPMRPQRGIGILGGSGGGQPVSGALPAGAAHAGDHARPRNAQRSLRTAEGVTGHPAGCCGNRRPGHYRRESSRSGVCRHGGAPDSPSRAESAC